MFRLASSLNPLVYFGSSFLLGWHLTLLLSIRTYITCLFLSRQFFFYCLFQFSCSRQKRENMWSIANRIIRLNNKTLLRHWLHSGFKMGVTQRIPDRRHFVCVSRPYSRILSRDHSSFPPNFGSNTFLRARRQQLQKNLQIKQALLKPAIYIQIHRFIKPVRSNAKSSPWPSKVHSLLFNPLKSKANR